MRVMGGVWLGNKTVHWNDHSLSGERAEWVWFVSRSPIAQLLDLTRMEHIGARLWICTFDSGSIMPNEEETSAGWSVVDEAMVSPPMRFTWSITWRSLLPSPT